MLCLWLIWGCHRKTASRCHQSSRRLVSASKHHWFPRLPLLNCLQKNLSTRVSKSSLFVGAATDYFCRGVGHCLQQGRWCVPHSNPTLVFNQSWIRSRFSRGWDKLTATTNNNNSWCHDWERNEKEKEKEKEKKVDNEVSGFEMGQDMNWEKNQGWWLGERQRGGAHDELEAYLYLYLYPTISTKAQLTRTLRRCRGPLRGSLCHLLLVVS